MRRASSTLGGRNRRPTVIPSRHAVLVHLTADTWAVVAATVGAAIVGGVLGYVGLALQQRRQAERDARVRREQAASEARIRLEGGAAELLAAAQDVLLGVNAVRYAHERRTRVRLTLRLVGRFFQEIPPLNSLTELREVQLQPLLGRLLDIDQEEVEAQRTIALDAATILGPKLNRYLATAALLTLGEDKVIADAVRAMTPKVTVLTESFSGPRFETAKARNRRRERLAADLQKVMEQFREVADKRLGNVKT